MNRPVARLAPSYTTRVELDRPLPFRWVGKRVEGFRGDTVASALWASGVRTFGRSFEYHRPRGLFDLEGEGASQLVAIDHLPNQSAGTTPLQSGMSVFAQNVSGDPRSDRYGFLDRFDRLMPAGFYYRLFHRPYRAWPFFQNRMRAMAGLGVLNTQPRVDEVRRSELYLNAEVAIIGGGVAGMAAALSATGSGVRVCLFERRPWLGGHMDWRARELGDERLCERARRLAEEVDARPEIRVFTAAPVTGIWGENLVTGFQAGSPADGFDQRHWECRAKSVVVANGMLERPLVFNDNDRPGIMLVDTAWRLARTYAVRPGGRAVFSVGDDLGLEAAIDLATLGVEVLAVADARSEGHDSEMVRRLSAQGIEFLPGYAASQTIGRTRVTGVMLGALDDADERRFDCDLLVASAGRQPDIGVLSTSGARFRHSMHTHTFEVERLPAGVFAAGGVTGLTDPDAIEVSGQLAGLAACAVLPGGETSPNASAAAAARARLTELPGPPSGCPILHGPNLGSGRKAFLDFDEDGTWKNAVQCADQGFDVPELAKRFGNFGLGPGQYRVPGQNVAMAMADINGTPVEQIQCTTVRPPVVPPLLATLAGPDHDIWKRTPLHDDQAGRGGIFRRAGHWRRVRYFSEDRACREEIQNVRESVGLLDSSPLGKFRIYGPDALRALQRVYISNMTKAKPDRCKYSAMCNDTGNIIDDGVVVPVGDDDYYFTTSSSRAGSTVEWFRYHTRYDGWNYNLVNLTDTLASINMAGPNARRVLQKITEDDVSNEALPYIGYRRITVGDGVSARCLRLGFVGELSYELHVDSSVAQYVWDLLWRAGEEFGIQPFGLEAQYSMRAEKGHVIIGAESEQRVTLLDIGMGWMWDRDDVVSKKVGAPALRACEHQDDRLKLIGLRIDDTPAAPQDGALIVKDGDILGYVCTTRHSDALGWQYGLALMKSGVASPGDAIELYENLNGRPKRTRARIVPPHFYDPDGSRLRT